MEVDVDKLPEDLKIVHDEMQRLMKLYPGYEFELNMRKIES